MKDVNHHARLGFALLVGLSLSIFTEGAPASASAGHEITGDYRYTFHDPETPADAKAHACREAAKASVSRSAAFRDATASVVDSAWMGEMLEAVVRDALQDLQIVEQVQKETTVSCTVKGRLDPQDVTRVLVTQMKGRPELNQPGLDQNRALKILRTYEDREGNLLVVFQALRRLDWLSTAYQGSLREQADIMVEFYDGQGQLLSQTRVAARKTTTGDDVMNPGEVGTRKIGRPAGAKTYRVWVAK